MPNRAISCRRGRRLFSGPTIRDRRRQSGVIVYMCSYAWSNLVLEAVVANGPFPASRERQRAEVGNLRSLTLTARQERNRPL